MIKWRKLDVRAPGWLSWLIICPMLRSWSQGLGLSPMSGFLLSRQSASSSATPHTVLSCSLYPSLALSKSLLIAKFHSFLLWENNIPLYIFKRVIDNYVFVDILLLVLWLLLKIFSDLLLSFSLSLFASLL